MAALLNWTDLVSSRLLLPLKLAIVAVPLTLAACTTMPLGEKASLSQGLYTPVLDPQTKISASLTSLPPPARRVKVAVYDFPDLTGQFKDSQTVQTLSKAVTQGGGSMLIKSLQDAGDGSWFSVLDRQALNDVLKERQIVTEMRKEYRDETQINASVLPPLADAGIILEGGIIGYDSNTMTGGAGASFLGIGGDTQWTQDTVTVTLRAVSTKTSEVLASVTVDKVLASVALDGNVYRYVATDQLLQAESGFTQNEPKQIAVQEAIDKAVMSLILEGAQLRIWSFADKAAGNGLIQQYMKEKYDGASAVVATGPALPETKDPATLAQTVPLTPVAIGRPVVRTYSVPMGGQTPPGPQSSIPLPTGALPPPEERGGEPVD
ncbi:MAG TPA: CsgG/HfaB family protein [Acetobacteraceae bacterium]|nr:CsgG/HfaB family protein [Acetobacteraceae bacterium]